MQWRALTWMVVSTIATTASWGANDRLASSSFRIAQGTQNSVCRASLDALHGLPRQALFNGGWRESFGPISWVDDYYRTVTAEGRDWSVPYKYVRMDIDNDGAQDIVLVYTGSTSSLDIDHLFVMSPSEFKERRKGHSVTRGVQINPDNTVLFKSGASAAPDEVHVWQRKG